MARISVRVRPGARTTRFDGWYGEHPRLAVAAPPVGGAANEEVRRAIAAAFGVPVRDVRIVVGSASRTKHVEIGGLEAGDVSRRLVEIVGPRPVV
jgi:uncharacterized protein YggU (UPF0235/DUF167 family)